MVNKMVVGIVAAIVVIAVLVPVVYFVTNGSQKPKKHVPVASFTATPTTVPHNKSVNFNAVQTTDPNKSDIPKLVFSWDFGDGTTGSNVTILHKFVKDGDYKVILTVMDPSKYTNSTSQVIKVFNVAPSITGSVPVATSVSMNEGTNMLFNVSLYDENLDTLALSWFIDDKITSETSSKFNYSASYTSAGTHKIKAFVTDGKLNDSKTWVVTVTNVDRAPIFSSISPATNFTMPEGQNKPLKVTASDPDGDNMTFTWKLDNKQIKTGTTASSNYTYSPDYNANGTHVIEVSYSDGTLSTAHTWKMIVSNVNRAPVIDSFSPMGDVIMKETETKDFIINATDPDGDAITFNWTLNGVLSSIHVKTYNFPTNYSTNGTYILIGIVSDKTLSTQHRWNITVQNLNRAPVAKAQVDFLVRNETEQFTFNGTASTDPDGDLLTYSWQYGDGSTDIGQQVTHAYTVWGLFRVNLTVKDPYGATSTDSVNVTVLQPIPSMKQLYKIGPSEEQWIVSLIADVDNDGNKELVVGSDNSTDFNNVSHGNVSIFDLKTHTLEWKSGDIGIVSALAAANLDADPALELVVGLQTGQTGIFTASTFGKILLIDGSTHAVEKTGLNIGRITTINVTDINADGKLEIVAGYDYAMSFSFVPPRIDTNGGLIVYDTNLAIKFNSTGWGTGGVMVLGNLDGDPAIEMIVVYSKSYDLATNVWDMNVSSFEWNGFTPVEKGTLKSMNMQNLGGFAIGDIDGDGNSELLIGDCYNDTGSPVFKGNLTVYTQELVSKHKLSNIGGVLSIGLANLYGAGMDIIVGIMDHNDGANRTGKIIVYDKTYHELWHSSEIGAVQEVLAGDVNGDGKLEIIAGSNSFDDGMGTVTTTLYVFSSTTHLALFKFDGLHDLSNTEIYVVDVDGNGTMDIVFIDWNSWDWECNIYAVKV